MIIKSRDPKNPEGAVLLFALIIMMLMGLMSAAIFLNTKTELDISRNTDMGRDAFTKADAAARLAVQLARPLLTPSIGNPLDYINNQKGPFKVELGANFNRNYMEDLAGEGREQEIINRYLEAAATADPQLVIRYNGEIVAAAAVAISHIPPPPGSSVDGQGAAGENTTRAAAIMVTATGRRTPRAGADDDYFGGDTEAPHSVVSTIYKDKVNY